MQIVIYGKKDCPYCERAKLFLENRNLGFQYYELDTHFNRKHIVENFPTMRTFPIILIDEKLIGGYTDLIEAAAFDEDFGKSLLKG